MVDRQDHQPAPDKEPVGATGREDPTPPATLPTTQPRPDDDNDSTSELDALELREIATQGDDEAGFSTESISSGEYRIRTQRTVSRPVHTSRETSKGVWGRIRRFWTRNVVLTVPQKSNRDHFALERTFLAYIRTSVMVAMQGVLIAQLFRLQHLTSPDNALGFYEVGVPLAVSCYGVAILIAFMGAYRFWKQQNVVALGTVYAGGWELNCIGVMIGLIILATFVLSVVITIELENE
ncbi:DUF202 domain-containing protein [Aspergillus ibericus CBS 121593]|uniref:DUF202 domain-containing protein n=1 Tax=Aspergillus ibericus CBS 121593 TaxID=1448316 RepID=A0A395H6P2_9EURO|nr:hypothetical protein BO80DRAFT_423527 [Aspergillus ibericus CBS 121593]RAL02538.1 hypothetical protein BO80DRAFT_423527 [Aspergillus ibericus CBS 121593]